MQPSELGIEASQEFLEALGTQAVAKDTERRVVEDRVAQRQMTKLPPGQVLGDPLAQLTLGGNVVDRHEDQGTDQHLRVDRWAANPRVVFLVEESNQGSEIEVRIDAQKQMLGIDEVAESLGRAGVQRTVAEAAIDGLEQGPAF